MEAKTPWQRVFEKFGGTQTFLADKLGRHRSKISRALRDEKGLISGRDQEMILEIAKSEGVRISPSDLMPGR